MHFYLFKNKELLSLSLLLLLLLLLLLYYHHDVGISRFFVKKRKPLYGEGCRLQSLIGRVSGTFIKWLIGLLSIAVFHFFVVAFNLPHPQLHQRRNTRLRSTKNLL